MGVDRETNGRQSGVVWSDCGGDDDDDDESTRAEREGNDNRRDSWQPSSLQ